MDRTPGSVGTTASLSLRLGQALFSTASLLFMSVGVEFYSYTAFWSVFNKSLIFNHRLCLETVISHPNMLSSDNHGPGDSMECYPSYGRHILGFRRVPSSPTWCNDHCGCRGLGLSDTVAGSSLCECQCRRPSRSHGWDELREVPAVRSHGILILVSHRCFVSFQFMARGLVVIASP